MNPNFPAEITNMVMVYDKQRDMVVIEDRKKYWTGYAFPGGHAEAGESLAESAIREVYEETGLRLKNVQACGLIHWDCADGKYMVHLYRSSDFEGELNRQASDEGSVEWIPLERLKDIRIHEPSRLAGYFGDYLRVFLDDGYHELYAWESKDDHEPVEFRYY